LTPSFEDRLTAVENRLDAIEADHIVIGRESGGCKGMGN
jgi:hypothetical protein